MTESDWIAAVLTAARPQALAALLRRFRDLDVAEESFQEACLRALKNWPAQGPPRHPTAWLIMVGRNATVDRGRRMQRETELPEEAALSDLEDAETPMIERLEGANYADDVLRLLFVCCHPDLPATQQIALALRVVSGLGLPQIARAFLVSETAMEQRITRAKARVASADVPFGAPGAVERAERLAAVAAMLYLLFNEGYSALGGAASVQSPLCAEAIRLTRLLLRLFPAEPEIMGLLALMLLQHSRAAARFDSDGELVLLEDQDRSLWDRRAIAEGLALIDKALRHRRPGAFQIQAALAGLHARAATPADTDWAQMDLLYAALETLQPSPVVRLNRAVAVAKLRGPVAALAMIEPLEARLAGYYPFHGARGAFLLQIGRRDEARDAFNRAIALAENAAEAGHIRRHLDRLMRESEILAKPDVGRRSPRAS
jgi:RNA polymerase sigma-70 factor, ECF subfamily